LSTGGKVIALSTPKGVQNRLGKLLMERREELKNKV
jgi:predicted NAD-dependent protein-ADP-ribosyltransferase YbiA (DUF1768 family)